MITIFENIKKINLFYFLNLSNFYLNRGNGNVNRGNGSAK